MRSAPTLPRTIKLRVMLSEAVLTSKATSYKPHQRAFARPIASRLTTNVIRWLP
jgi:hypothetical protein